MPEGEDGADEVELGFELPLPLLLLLRGLGSHGCVGGMRSGGDAAFFATSPAVVCWFPQLPGDVAFAEDLFDAFGGFILRDLRHELSTLACCGAAVYHFGGMPTISDAAPMFTPSKKPASANAIMPILS